MRIEAGRESGDLVRRRKLRDRDRVLIGMSRPRAVHRAGRFVLLVLGQDAQGALVEFGVFAAGEKSRHPAHGEHAVLVGDRRYQPAQVLEEGDVVRNGVAIGEDPIWVGEREVD